MLFRAITFVSPVIRMKIDFKSDGHVHTALCLHATGSMEEYVKIAIDRGLEKLYFLEHLEAGINYFERTWLTDDDFSEYFREGHRLQGIYGDRLLIGLGVEVGYNPERAGEIVAKLAKYQWDRIAVSYHFMRVGNRHYNLVSRKYYNIEALGEQGVSKVVSDYFAVMLEAVETIPAEVVCHLDAVMRYHPQIKLESGHFRQIEEILDAMAAREMALEVNASGCRMRGEPFPAKEIIQEALRRNISLVAGSDAHRPEDVGSFADLAKIFQKA